MACFFLFFFFILIFTYVKVCHIQNGSMISTGVSPSIKFINLNQQSSDSSIRFCLMVDGEIPVYKHIGKNIIQKIYTMCTEEYVFDIQFAGLVEHPL